MNAFDLFMHYFQETSRVSVMCGKSMGLGIWRDLPRSLAVWHCVGKVLSSKLQLPLGIERILILRKVSIQYNVTEAP